MSLPTSFVDTTGNEQSLEVKCPSQHQKVHFNVNSSVLKVRGKGVVSTRDSDWMLS